MSDDFVIRKMNVSAIDNCVADKIIESKNSDCAMLYLYLLRSEQPRGEQHICADLGFDRERLRAAELMLHRCGAFGEDCPPEQSKAQPVEISQARRQDPAFSSLCSFFEKSAGRIIKRGEISALYDAYARLNLSPSVIMTLITHLCGAGGGISAVKFEREACRWHDVGISTLEQAENHLRESRERSGKTAEIAKALKISGRPLSPSERGYIEKWIALGFPAQTVELAYDKTILNTGTLRWGYLDKILANWAQKELFSPEQAKSEHSDTQSEAAQAASGGEINQSYLNQVKEYLKNKKNPAE